MLLISYLKFWFNSNLLPQSCTEVVIWGSILQKLQSSVQYYRPGATRCPIVKKLTKMTKLFNEVTLKS